MPTNGPPPPPTMQPTPPASPDTTPAPTTPWPFFTTTPAPTTTTPAPSTTTAFPTTTALFTSTALLFTSTTAALFTTTPFSFGAAMQTTPMMMMPALFLANRTRGQPLALLQQPARRPGGAVPNRGYTPVDHCNCPCADPHVEALLEAEQNALREARPVNIYPDDMATSAAWGAVQPQEHSPQSLPPHAPSPGMLLSATAVSSRVALGAATLQDVQGVQGAALQGGAAQHALEQTAALRKVLQGWAADQPQQDEAVQLAPAGTSPPTIGLADVDAASFG